MTKKLLHLVTFKKVSIAVFIGYDETKIFNNCIIHITHKGNMVSIFSFLIRNKNAIEEITEEIRAYSIELADKEITKLDLINNIFNMTHKFNLF